MDLRMFLEWTLKIHHHYLYIRIKNIQVNNTRNIFYITDFENNTDTWSKNPDLTWKLTDQKIPPAKKGLL